MALGNKVPHVQHGKYVTEIKTNMSMYKQIIAPQILLAGQQDLHGANFSLCWCYLTKPFYMVAEPHTHEFDQLVMFLGGDPENVGDFDAEIEFAIGEDLEKHVITYPACFFVPKGTLHGELNITKINKPVMYMDITLSPTISFRPIPEESK